MEVLPPNPAEIPSPIAPRGIAPVWHTVILIAALALLSVEGAKEMSGPGIDHTNRLLTYLSTAISEMLMLGWVWFGLRLRKVPFRSLFGDLSGGAKTFFLDMAVAGAFWICALMVLGTLGLVWTVTELAMKHQSLVAQAGKHVPPDPAQQHLIHALGALAPSKPIEIVAWGVMCLMAGLVEELVFRGYFQRQFTAWGRGAIAVGVAGSALMFGASHGYQGIRNMVLLTVFGALFSSLALLRRNLRAGIMAHAWHDFVIGLLIAFLRSKNLI